MGSGCGAKKSRSIPVTPRTLFTLTRSRASRAQISIKGEGGLGKPFIKGAGTLTKASGARLITLGVDTGKEEIADRLIVEKPGPGFSISPAATHSRTEAGRRSGATTRNTSRD